MTSEAWRPGSAGWRRPQTGLQKLVRLDVGILTLVAAIAAIGTATLYAGAGGSMTPWAEPHVARLMAGFVVLLAFAFVPPGVWLRVAYPAYAAALVPLLLLPLVGTEAMGARRWLPLGLGLAFQPSEVMKVALVGALAAYYQALPRDRVSVPSGLVVPLLLVALPVLLTLKQPDLGTAVMFTAIGLSLMFLAGVSPLYFAGGGVAAVAALPLLLGSLHGYQKKRLEVYLDPSSDPLGAGYHITQSKIALGSGGLEGKGFMMGTQSRLDFVPEKHTDFVFAMFAEEWGFLGACVLIALYAALVGLLLWRAHRAGTTFGRLLSAGAAVTIFVYVFVNIAMVSGLLPVVGVPLPFMSYGGSAMLSLLVMLGIVMSAHIHTDVDERRSSTR